MISRSARKIWASLALVTFASSMSSAALACIVPKVAPSRAQALAAKDKGFAFRGRVIDLSKQCKTRNGHELCIVDARIEVLENLGQPVTGTIVVNNLTVSGCCLCNHVPRAGAEEYFILSAAHAGKILQVN